MNDNYNFHYILWNHLGQRPEWCPLNHHYKINDKIYLSPNNHAIVLSEIYFCKADALTKLIHVKLTPFKMPLPIPVEEFINMTDEDELIEWKLTHV